MDQPWMVKGCKHPDGAEVRPPQSFTGVCSIPKVSTLPRRDVPHTVSDAVESLEAAWEEQGFVLESTSGKCPLCPESRRRVRGWRFLDGDPPDSLLFHVPMRTKYGRIYPPTPSGSVMAYGKRYRLLSVIYFQGFSKHFYCQTLFRGSWWRYSNYCSRPTRHEYGFKYSPFGNEWESGQPTLYAYVRDSEDHGFYERTAREREGDRLRELQPVSLP